MGGRAGFGIPRPPSDTWKKSHLRPNNLDFRFECNLGLDELTLCTFIVTPVMFGHTSVILFLLFVFSEPCFLELVFFGGLEVMHFVFK